MQTEVKTLHESESLTAASSALFQTRHHGLPVLNPAGELAGILTIQDIDRAQSEKNGSVTTVGQACTRDLLTVYPDETIGTALRRMSVRDVGRLPVVGRENPRQLLGILRRTDIVRVYDAALTRRAALRHRAHQVRLDSVTDSQVRVEEITIETGAFCMGKRVSEVAWPRDAILVTLRRGRQVFIPHGDTVLLAGDVLVVITENGAQETIYQLCQTPMET